MVTTTEIEEEMIGSVKSLQVVAEKDLVQETAIQVGVYKALTGIQFQFVPLVKCMPHALLPHSFKPIRWKVFTKKKPQHNH